MVQSPTDTFRRLAELQPAVFEQLASNILRAHSPYESLVPCGLNEIGRPVSAPVDGVCWIPGTSEGVLFAYTSTDPKRIRDKWLLDSAQAPRRKAKAEGDACTADPPEELVTTVKARCLEARVDVDFWTASRLVNFLDNDPRGHWLRQEALEIPARRVSWELLHALTERSCRTLGEFISEDPEAPHVERELDRKLWEEFQKIGRGVRFLVSESGFGKSSTALSLLRRHSAAGGIGLWLLPDDLTRGGSVEGAVEVALRRLKPELQPGCGTEAIRSAAGGRGLLLVVDDLSCDSAPDNLLRRLVASAGRPKHDEGVSGAPVARGWFLICPIWPRFLSQLPEILRTTIQPLCLYGGTYTASEGASFLRARSKSLGEELTEMEALQLSESLGHDPLLLSLLDLGRKDLRGNDCRPISLRVIDSFLDSNLSRLSSKGAGGHLVAAEYEDALLDLADRMLLERELAPSWRRIGSWFRSSSSGLDALRQMVADCQIAHVPEGEDVLHFRHDRVRDAILAAALARSMRTGTLAEVILSDPFYAEILGQALLAPGVEPALVDKLRNSNPLALFRALQLFGVPRDPLQDATVRGLRAWLAEEVITDRALDALQWEAVRFLAETDSPLVLDLVRTFPQSWHHVIEAGFRNGDILAAATYCAEMQLGVLYSGFEPLVEHFKARSGKVSAASLEVLLNQGGALPKYLVQGSLILAGHLAEQALAPAVKAAWDSATDQQGPLLGEFVWAALRCLPRSEENLKSWLKPLFETWQAIAVENQDDSKIPGYYEIVSPLQNAFLRRGLCTRAISELIRRAVGSLKRPIVSILLHVDSPEAIESPSDMPLPTAHLFGHMPRPGSTRTCMETCIDIR